MSEAVLAAPGGREGRAVHLHHTLVAVLSRRDVQGRVPVDVHGVQVTLCCQQDLSYVNTARKSSPVQTNVFLLEGKENRVEIV